uniref:Uncharacterized protein n=1 Tax=Human herpesvirus 6B TaxID=32604 RepID=A0A2L2QE81_HHV6H|nr:hypothetical protein [Human betaherpesvirus 6B]AVI09432.1 hypothetical protein [Human betaherpesvirus 6B]
MDVSRSRHGLLAEIAGENRPTRPGRFLCPVETASGIPLGALSPRVGVGENRAGPDGSETRVAVYAPPVRLGVPARFLE